MSALTQKIATSSARRRGETKLLVIDRAADQVTHARVGELYRYLRRGDRLVVNDAATLPASFRGRHERTGKPVELRLLSPLEVERVAPGSPRPGFLPRWRAVVFGGGDWRTATEDRELPPRLESGDRLLFAGGLVASVMEVCRDISERLLDVQLLVAPQASGAIGLLDAVYVAGRPIQYFYLEKELEPWDQQTLFSGPPVALEPPSAAFALTWANVFRLRELGVEVLTVTHGTGVSDTGDPRINALLPLPELSIVSDETERRLTEARVEDARIIAVGTGTVRALESWARGARGLTSLKIRPDSKLEVVTGILTGMHDAGASHLELLGAWRAGPLLERGYREAQARGYLWHEYGDQCLVL